MYIFKNPKIGGEVGAHKDSSFLITKPLSVCGIWVSLDEATKEMGACGVSQGAIPKALISTSDSGIMRRQESWRLSWTHRWIQALLKSMIQLELSLWRLLLEV